MNKAITDFLVAVYGASHEAALKYKEIYDKHNEEEQLEFFANMAIAWNQKEFEKLFISPVDDETN